jgi:hypothetical protein
MAQPAVVVLETGEGGHAGFVAAAGWGGEIFVLVGTDGQGEVGLW